MPTATVKLSNQNRVATTCTLTDSGYQKSFIDKCLTEELKWPVISTTRMKLSTSGFESIAQEFDAVRVKIQSGSCRFTAKYFCL